jgi:hypothetical protein
MPSGEALASPAEAGADRNGKAELPAWLGSAALHSAEWQPPPYQNVFMTDGLREQCRRMG